MKNNVAAKHFRIIVFLRQKKYIFRRLFKVVCLWQGSGQYANNCKLHLILAIWLLLSNSCVSAKRFFNRKRLYDNYNNTFYLDQKTNK